MSLIRAVNKSDANRIDNGIHFNEKHPSANPDNPLLRY